MLPSKIPPSEFKELSLTKYGGLVLNEIPTEDVLNHISVLLTDIAKLYQIPNWTPVNSVHLAGWILRTYKYEQLETVTNCLKNPIGSSERMWRLTPDTIQGWFDKYLERVAEELERLTHNEPFKELAPLKEEERREGVPEEWEDSRLTEWLKELEKVEAKKIPPLTEEDIMKEGQEIPAKPFYNPPGKEYKTMLELKIKYGQECTDLHTGKQKPGTMNFDEWILTQK